MNLRSVLLLLFIAPNAAKRQDTDVEEANLHVDLDVAKVSEPTTEGLKINLPQCYCSGCQGTSNSKCLEKIAKYCPEGSCTESECIVCTNKVWGLRDWKVAYEGPAAKAVGMDWSVSTFPECSSACAQHEFPKYCWESEGQMNCFDVGSKEATAAATAKCGCTKLK
mmetsp:Transcript_8032/g.8842  ORF Transcript_8032/g.8842 Transcript_8032/m.8842 type:complete len:166 (+) Transcript_8032:115-612(+)